MKKLIPLLALATLCLYPTRLDAHCQVPCGIYDDQLRADLIAEDITTIEKAMQQITELSGQTPVNYNQLVRWINTKEFHAGDIQKIVSEYFLTQRIKPDTDRYEEKLKVLHGMLLAAMRCKQTTDLENVKQLRDLLKQFEVLYFGHTHRD
ncbi:MAG: superoxide dismutase [Ni] [Acidobacteriota bacterium]